MYYTEENKNKNLRKTCLGDQFIKWFGIFHKHLINHFLQLFISQLLIKKYYLSIITIKVGF